MIGGAVARHSIDVLRAPLIDDGRGNRSPDWSNQTETASPGWAIDTAATAEDETHRTGDSISYTLRGPFAADVIATDRVRLFGETFQITGGVLRQPGPSALTSHTIIQLTRWEG